MIGLMDLTEDEQIELLRVVQGRLVYFRRMPAIYCEYGSESREGWVWMGHQSWSARRDTVECVRSLIAHGVLERPLDGNQVMPTREAVPLIRQLQGLD